MSYKDYKDDLNHKIEIARFNLNQANLRWKNRTDDNEAVERRNLYFRQGELEGLELALELTRIDTIRENRIKADSK